MANIFQLKWSSVQLALNNMGLNFSSPFIQGYFSIVKFYSTTWTVLQLVESLDSEELEITSANHKL